MQALLQQWLFEKSGVLDSVSLRQMHRLSGLSAAVSSQVGGTAVMLEHPGWNLLGQELATW